MSGELPIRVRCFQIVVRPLVRLLLRGSHTLQDAIDVLKVVFVEEGAEQMQQAGSKVTISRLSVMTGVHRTDVTRIFQKKEAPQRQVSSLLWRVMGLWENGEDFTIKRGRPKPLTFGSLDSEFHELVFAVSRSINPATVLFELERIGAVERLKDKIHLVKDVQRFEADLAEGYQLLGDDVSSMIAAVEENLLAPRPIKNLHIRTEYDNVSKRHISTIRAWMLEEGKAFHRRAREFISQFDRDINSGLQEEGGGKVVIQAYSLTAPAEYIEDEEKRPPSKEARPKRTRKLTGG